MSNTLESSPEKEVETANRPSAPQQGKRKVPKRLLLGILGIVIIAVVAAVALNHGKESTDDAFVEGHVMQVSPQIAGMVQRVLVDDNQMVKAGDLLVELDPRDNKAVYDQALANLASTEAKLAQAKAQLDSSVAAASEAGADVDQARANADNASKDFTRSQELRTRGVIAQQELDRDQAGALATKAVLESKSKKAVGATSDVKVNDAQVKSAEAQVELAKSLVETATLRLSYTQIHAPESGRVTRKNVETGNYVQTGAALMAIVPEDVWVVANFKETQLNHMRPGQHVDIKIDAYPSLHIEGKVDSIQSGTGARFSLLPSENATGNYVKVVQRLPVKILFTNLPKDMPQLSPGMSVVPTVDVH